MLATMVAGGDVGGRGRGLQLGMLLGRIEMGRLDSKEKRGRGGGDGKGERAWGDGDG